MYASRRGPGASWVSCYVPTTHPPVALVVALHHTPSMTCNAMIRWDGSRRLARAVVAAFYRGISQGSCFLHTTRRAKQPAKLSIVPAVVQIIVQINPRGVSAARVPRAGKADRQAARFRGHSCSSQPRSHILALKNQSRTTATARYRGTALNACVVMLLSMAARRLARAPSHSTPTCCNTAAMVLAVMRALAFVSLVRSEHALSA
jgi:hypothetical protein